MEDIIIPSLKEEIAALAERLTNSPGWDTPIEYQPGPIKVLSDRVAAVRMWKQKTQKWCLVIFWWVNTSDTAGRWLYIIPTDSHVVGFNQVGPLLAKVQAMNFPQEYRNA